MTRIQFHIEGGAGKNLDTEMRRAFHVFFSEINRVAREQGGSLRYTLHGPRLIAYKRFCNALRDDPETYHVLLVDSEDPVKRRGECWRHLLERQADGWERPAGTDKAQCQLMVQAVEAWFFADPDTLQAYYGAGFNASSLPTRQNVEAIPKSEHLPSLEAASRQTKKGLYHKTRHLPDILGRISPAKVRERAWHCDRIFVTLAEKLGAELPPLCRLAPEP